MISKQQKINPFSPISAITEHSRYNLNLYQTNLFPYEHTHRFSSIESRVLSFRFRSIEFNKKRSLLFFLALELLTGKKAIASLSSRNIQSWKIRKGRLVGCKVTLRRESLHEFLDTFLLTLPRREKLYPFSIKTSKKSRKRVGSQIAVSFRFGELVLFYPIEVGIGLHPDFQYLQRNCKFNSITIEERLFHLRAFHFPINLFIY